MGFIPSDAEWYLADVVLELKIEDALPSSMWVNTHLIHAASPEEAFGKAEKIGHDGQQIYTNAEGNRVAFVYRGMAYLQVIYEPLEDGAEITWRDYDGLSEEEVKAFVVPKEQLGVFAPLQPETNPRYMDKRLMPVQEENADN